MKPGRFLRWQQARKTAAKIAGHLTSGGTAVIGTPVRATFYTRKHVEMFRAASSGLYVRNGVRWDCIDYCVIRLL